MINLKEELLLLADKVRKEGVLKDARKELDGFLCIEDDEDRAVCVAATLRKLAGDIEQEGSTIPENVGTMEKEPGQTYWEAEFKDTPWSNAHEDDRAEARKIEEACRKGFVPKKSLVAIVMRWLEAARAGDEGATEYCVGETFLRAAKLVLEEDKLEEVEHLYIKLGG